MTNVVKSVQQVSITIAAASTSNTATITSVNTANAILIYQGVTTTTAANTDFAKLECQLEITNGTTITATRGNSLLACTVNCTIVEFVSGVNSIQSGTINIGTGSTSNTATISAVGSNAFVLHCGQSTVTASSFGAVSTGLVLTNSTTVTANNGVAGSNLNVNFMVVDLDGTILNSVPQAVSKTDATSATSYTATISSVNVNNAIVAHNGQIWAASNGAIQQLSHTAILTNSTTVTFARNAGGASTTRTIYATVIEFVGGILNRANQRGTMTFGSGSATITATISAVNTSLAVANWNGMNGPAAAGGPIAYMPRLTLTNSTTVTGSVNTAGGTTLIGYEVVEFASAAVTTTLTGVAATAHVGTVIGSPQAVIVGVASSANVGTLTVSASASPTLTGVASSANVGTLTVSASASPTLTGVASSANVGTLTTEVDKSVTLTGVASSANVGTLTVSASASPTLTGVAATTNVGTLTTEVDKSVTLTGVASSANVGTLIGNPEAIIAGVAATAAVGTLTVAGDTSVTITGVAATAHVGTLAAAVSVTIAGVAAQANVGILHTSDNNPNILGVAALPNVGDLSVQITAGVTLTGVAATAHVGTVIGSPEGVIAGVAATAHVGAFTFASTVTIAGVAAQANVGQVLSRITPNTTNANIVGVAAQANVGTIMSKVSTLISGVASQCNVGTLKTITSIEGFTLAKLLCDIVPGLNQDVSVSLRYSDTKGASWSNSVQQSMGLTGQYQTNMQWRRLGYGRDRVFEISWSGASPTALTGAFISFEEMGT